MTPLIYYKRLSTNAKKRYAQRADCSHNYMQQKLMNGKGVMKIPRVDLVVRLAHASQGNVSLDESIDYFLVSPCKKLAKELEKLPSGTLEEAA